MSWKILHYKTKRKLLREKDESKGEGGRLITNPKTPGNATGSSVKGRERQFQSTLVTSGSPQGWGIRKGAQEGPLSRVASASLCTQTDYAQLFPLSQVIGQETDSEQRFHLGFCDCLYGNKQIIGAGWKPSIDLGNMTANLWVLEECTELRLEGPHVVVWDEKQEWDLLGQKL